MERLSTEKRILLGSILLLLIFAVLIRVTLALAPERRERLLCGSVEHIHTAECVSQITETQDELICTETEHIHGRDCYTDGGYLQCRLREHYHTAECFAPHTHGDACYDDRGDIICGYEDTEKTVYTCGFAEHTHTTACYAVNSSKKTAYCGRKEHIHGDACFDDIGILTCSREEHTHTDECFLRETAGKKTYFCGNENHEHTLACESDKYADFVSKREWEESVNAVSLTGDRRCDLLAVAESQLGYRESEKNFLVSWDGEKKGYSAYGTWYGSMYGDWCAMFASFCIRYAGIDDYPIEASCTNWVRNLKRINCYHKKGEYEPQVGDLVFFDKSHDGGNSSDHVAIVRGVETENGKVTTITTVEGNCYNGVRTLRYKIYAEGCPIIGFAEIR